MRLLIKFMFLFHWGVPVQFRLLKAQKTPFWLSFPNRQVLPLGADMLIPQPNQAMEGRDQ